MSDNSGATGVVVIPTYNERENLALIVDAILAQDLGLDILIVDDNSPDGTGEIADGLQSEGKVAHVLHRQGKLGLGSAYVEGFRWSLDHSYPLVFQMDADFSHDPESLPDFIRAIERADVVIGSRYIRGITVVNWPLSRLLLSYFANMYARFVTGLPLRDATGGFKCWRHHALGSINLDRISSEGYSFQIEMNFRSWRRGFNMVELPIFFRDRQVGTSKMDFKINREAAWMVWKLRLLSTLGRL
jgi:dolichol-phosphate mannosyltransferase